MPERLVTIEEGSLVCHIRSHVLDPVTNKYALIASSICPMREDEVEVHLADDVDPADLFSAPGVTKCAVCFAELVAA